MSNIITVLHRKIFPNNVTNAQWFKKFPAVAHSVCSLLQETWQYSLC